MTDIDRLDIKIQAESQAATKSLDALARRLSSLSQSLGAINSTSLKGFTDGLKGLEGFDSKKLSAIASGLRSISNVDAANLQNVSSGISRLTSGLQSAGAVSLNGENLKQVASGIRSLSNISPENLQKIAEPLRRVVTALQPFNGASFDGQGFFRVAQGINELGKARVEKAIENLPKLGEALKKLSDSLSQTKGVDNNIIRLILALAALAAQSTGISTATRLLTGKTVKSTEATKKQGTETKKTASAMSNSKKSVTSLAAAFGKFYASMFLVIRGIKKLGESIKQSVNYIEVLNYFDAAFGQVTSKADLSQWQNLGYKSAEAYADSFAERAKELTEKMTGFTVDKNGMLSATGVQSLGINPAAVMNYQAMFAQMSSSMGVTAENSLKLSNALTMIGADLASVKNLNFEDVWKDMSSGLAGMSRTLDKYGVNIRNVNLQEKLHELGIEKNISKLNQQDKALLRTIVLLESTKYAWGDLADTIDKPANQLRLLQSNMKMLGQMIGNLFLPALNKLLPVLNAVVIALQRVAAWLARLMGIDLTNIVSSRASNDMSALSTSLDEVSDSMDDVSESAKEMKKGVRGFDELNVIGKNDNSGTQPMSDDTIDSLLSGALDDALSEYQKAWQAAFDNMTNRAQELADKIQEKFKPLKEFVLNIKAGNWDKVGKQLSDFFINNFKRISQKLKETDWYNLGHSIGEKLRKGISDFLSNIDWKELILSGLDLAVTLTVSHIEFGAGLIMGLLPEGVQNYLIDKGEKIRSYLLDPLVKYIEEVAPKISELGSKFLTVFEPIGEYLATVWTDVFSGLNTIFDDLITIILPELGKGFKDWFNNIILPGASLIADVLEPAFRAMGETFQMVWQHLFVPLGKFFREVFLKVLESLVKIQEKWSVEIRKNMEIFQELWNTTLKPIVNWMWDNIKPVIEDVWVFIEDCINSIKQILIGLIDFITGVLTGDWEQAIEGLGEILAGSVNAMIGMFEMLVNSGIDSINGFIKGINKLGKDTLALIGISAEIPLIPRVKIPRLEDGGYPSKASLFFAGENGIPEMLGTIGGRTAVAGGAEITGIADAVYATGNQNATLLSTAVGLLEIIADKEYGISDSEIFSSVRRSSDIYKKRTGRDAF